MARLPQPGGDDGVWGSVLNDFLSQAHKNDGSLNDNSVSGTTIADNAIGAAKLNAQSGSDGQVLTRSTSASGGLTWTNRISSSEKGAASGVATLDANSHVTASQLAGVAASAVGGGQELVSTINATGITSLNLANGNAFNVTLQGDTTFTITGATSGRVCAFTLYLTQDSTGNRKVTWPSGTKWSGGAPTLSTSAGAIDIVVLESINGGTTWFGSLVGTNFS